MNFAYNDLDICAIVTVAVYIADKFVNFLVGNMIARSVDSMDIVKYAFVVHFVFGNVAAAAAALIFLVIVAVIVVAVVGMKVLLRNLIAYDSVVALVLFLVVEHVDVEAVFGTVTAKQAVTL